MDEAKPGEPIGLHCPECGELARFVLTGGEQAFCGNDACRILMWDPTQTREEMEAEGVHEINLGPEFREETTVRDAFIVFLMVIAAGLLAGVPVTLRWGFSSGNGDDALMSVIGAAILLGAAIMALVVVGHAVGVSVPGLGR